MLFCKSKCNRNYMGVSEVVKPDAKPFHVESIFVQHACCLAKADMCGWILITFDDFSFAQFSDNHFIFKKSSRCITPRVTEILKMIRSQINR